MPVFNITFTVDGESQTITRTSPRKIRAGSANYFYAVFTFLDSYFTSLEGLTAVFSGVPYERNRGGGYKVPLEGQGDTRMVKVPWEVLTRRGTVYVGVFAGDMLVTNEAEFEVTKAAPTDGGNPTPSRTWLAKLLEMIAGKQDKLTAGENITIEDNVISASGGGGGGDSLWELADGVLRPAESPEGVSFRDAPLAGVQGIVFSDNRGAVKIQMLFTAPTSNTAPIGGIGTLAYYNGNYYICTGGSSGAWIWSALATVNQVSVKYTLPENGIPKIDLEAAVQTSLGLADTALQSGDLAAYRTAAAQDAIDSAQDLLIGEKYAKPASGIPKTDLASAVQTSLDKADTALQTHQDISGKQDKYIGTANAGKFLVVGSDGNITAVTMSAWQGGSY